MQKKQLDIGLVGMGVMGYSLLQNLADREFSVIGLDNNAERVASLQQEVGDRPLLFTTQMEEMVQNLSKPRKVWLMVPAGPPVDSVLKQLIPLLESGDIVMDGGNSHFEDTVRRQEELAVHGLHFLGVGVSGGEEGARFGPSIMPGGEEKAYKPIQPFLEAIAAKVKGEPCVSYLGKGGAGHYVKMVHNGIEYALMQLLAESYDLMHRAAGMENEAIAEVLGTWNEGRLQSFLVEISRDIFRQQDALKPGSYLIDHILDTAKQKGTGKWTSQSALDLGVPIPNIDAAVMFRYLSARKEQRVKASQWVEGAPQLQTLSARDSFLEELESVLYSAFLITYAQGFELLAQASHELNMDLNLATIARIWRGGCIIRAEMLNPMVRVFSQTPDLSNLMFADAFRDTILQSRLAWTSILREGLFARVALPVFSAGLAYVDGYFSKRLPANLIQAQRDYFGAHTYQRTDQSGTFHTNWNHE